MAKAKKPTESAHVPRSFRKCVQARCQTINRSKSKRNSSHLGRDWSRPSSCTSNKVCIQIQRDSSLVLIVLEGAAQVSNQGCGRGQTLCEAHQAERSRRICKEDSVSLVCPGTLSLTDWHVRIGIGVGTPTRLSDLLDSGKYISLLPSAFCRRLHNSLNRCRS